MKIEMQIDDKIMIAVAPGWIITGKITEIDEKSIKLEPAIWIENLNGPCTAASIDPKKIKLGNPYPTYVIIVRSAILWYCPASDAVVYAADLTALSAVGRGGK